MGAEKNNNKGHIGGKLPRNENNHECRKPFFKHYEKQDEMYSGGLQHVSGFMSVTLDQ